MPNFNSNFILSRLHLILLQIQLVLPFDNIYLGATTISSCGCYTYTKWLNNSYFNMLFPSFNNYLFNTIGGSILTQDWWCSILRLPIGIHYGVVCGCEYPSSTLFMVWIDEWIYWLYGPNWLPNSMPLNMFWTSRILDSCSYGWSINVPIVWQHVLKLLW